jgi:hypothetical protein
MIGFELAKQIKATKGKIYAFVPTVNDGLYIAVEKTQLIEWCNGCGDSETDMHLRFVHGNFYFETK